MKALNKQALRVPERKRRDWGYAVMRDCDFCSQWALTVKHDDGGCICASCCDAEYASELKGELEVAIDRAEAAEKRIAELEARTVTLPKDAEHDVMAPVVAYFLETFNWDGGAVRWDGRKEYDLLADRVKYALNMVFRRAAGIGVKGD